MANYVKIATIGSAAIRLSEDCTPQLMVDRMIAHWDKKFQQVLVDKPDLIVVPEACDKPYDFSPQKARNYYQVRGKQVQDFFAKVAADNKCYVVYSSIREMPDHTWRNSSVVIDRKGETAGIYNKNHVVIEETTQGGILYGKEAPIIHCDFGKVACAICFDLNFDELRSKYIKLKPDLIVFCSEFHGGLQHSIWAYSCRCHFVGAIVGLPSGILNPHGETLASTSSYKDYVVATVNLDCCLVHLDYNGEKLEELKKEYGERVNISVPDHIGSVLISSQCRETTVLEMIRKFEIETLEDYFVRALAHRSTRGNMEP